MRLSEPRRTREVMLTKVVDGHAFPRHGHPVGTKPRSVMIAWKRRISENQPRAPSPLMKNVVQALAILIGAARGKLRLDRCDGVI